MRLHELFDQSGDSLTQRLRRTAVDVITPFVAQNVPFITVGQIIDELRRTRPGLVIDRSTVFDLLDPAKVKAITKIEGDRIYLQPPDNPEREAGPDQAERDAEQVHKGAQKQAWKKLDSASPSPSPSPP